MTVFAVYAVFAMALLLIYGRAVPRHLTRFGVLMYSFGWPLWVGLLIVLTPPLWLSERFARRYYPAHVWRNLDGERVRRPL